MIEFLQQYGGDFLFGVPILLVLWFQWNTIKDIREELGLVRLKDEENGKAISRLSGIVETIKEKL